MKGTMRKTQHNTQHTMKGTMRKLRGQENCYQTMSSILNIFLTGGRT